MWVFRKQKPKRSSQAKMVRRTHYHQHREAARDYINTRLEYFNQYYQLNYNRVAIRNQKRCWGSCSAKRNLNFSYKLLFLPPCLADYIIVHELCHLRELNHSTRFWAAVGEIMPDYQKRAKILRNFERTHGTSIKALQTWSANHQLTLCEFCQIIDTAAVTAMDKRDLESRNPIQVL